MSVLHTWGSALYTHHPHVHMVVPGGGLSPDGSKWIACRPRYFLTVEVLSALFRRLFLQMLVAACRLVEQATQLAGGHRRAGLTARKQPTFLKGRCGIETPAHLPPLPQQIERLRRQHNIAILAALGLLDANDLLRGVDMLDLQPNHFAATQAAAIAETEQHTGLEARGTASRRRVSSGLITSGIFCGSRM